ncbi:flagellar type III secretion system protein FlhB [Paracoccus aminophilus]|uniref:Flagellar biosynthetic protein FlhB n=1 Tax=Paracoccus aminophilus JCM 7686 TaxID=1367847 RepID=S5XJT6_PARAH|nr:flagellar type III secretion system protein FlhB [Paracoccus aminophilus]AGT07454.1 flagellar biosynthetic protein FlhB [Paracoccus aminophilus JCM 7686]
MSESSDEEKTFDPTEQKLRRAREEGDVPRSMELNSALLYLGLWAAVGVIGAVAVPSWTRMAARALGDEPWPAAGPRRIFDLGWAMGGQAALAVSGAIGMIGVLILLGILAQQAFTFTPKKLVPDLKRINPLKNAKQKFGKTGLVTFAISLGKVSLVCIGGALLYRSLLGYLLTADFTQDRQWLLGLGTILRQVILLALAVSLLFAGVDLLWKFLEHRRRNRMSRKEMLDEHKESEGDPHFKAARRQKGVDIVLSQMLADVEKADVVIVNPTHYAVALEWKRGSGKAPVCLAKGVDDLARRIRERARDHDVPIFSDPPAARALYATVEIGEEIRQDHFAPVAAAIRFAEIMRRKARAGWGGGLRLSESRGTSGPGAGSGRKGRRR